MAVLLMTNAQWQQRQQQEAEARTRQQELQRLEQQRRMAAAQQEAKSATDPNAPWFYSDPQGNVQVGVGGLGSHSSFETASYYVFCLL
jgi:hypothetical protein